MAVTSQQTPSIVDGSSTHTALRSPPSSTLHTLHTHSRLLAPRQPTLHHKSSLRRLIILTRYIAHPPLRCESLDWQIYRLHPGYPPRPLLTGSLGKQTLANGSAGGAAQ